MLPGHARARRPRPARLLGWRPARFLGRISYSLYLWHWPMLVLPTAVAGETLPLPVRVGLMLAAIPIAYASQRWLEDPIRRGRLVGVVPRRNLALAGALSIAVAATSLGLGFVTTQRLAAATAGPGDDLDATAPPLPDLGGPGRHATRRRRHRRSPTTPGRPRPRRPPAATRRPGPGRSHPGPDPRRATTSRPSTPTAAT